MVIMDTSESNVGLSAHEQAEHETEEIKCSDVKLLRKEFWLIVTLCMFAIALYVPFLDNANKLLQVRFCYTQKSAGRAIMVTYLVAALFSAPLGLLVDYVGFKRYFIIVSMCIFTLAQSFILFFPQCDHSSAVLEQNGGTWGLALIGLGYCFYGNCIVPSIPLVVKKKVTGTAFGIMQMIESIALAFFPLISGVLVQKAANEEIGYRHSSLFYVTIGLIGVLVSLGLLFINPKIKIKFDQNSAERQLKQIVISSDE